MLWKLLRLREPRFPYDPSFKGTLVSLKIDCFFYNYFNKTNNNISTKVHNNNNVL